MTIGQYRTSEKTLSPSPEFFICLDFSNEIACVIALDSDDVFTSPQDIIPTNIDLEFNYWIESVLAASYQIYPLKTTC